MLSIRKKLLYIVVVFFFNLVSAGYDLDYAKQLIREHDIKVMAIYFPQFHEFEENNRLWGKGFTEWTLMNKFKGEIKRPHKDIGQYNMLDYNVRKKQAEMAKAHGVSAFCYYHYWFTDKKVMHAGVEKILEDGQPDLPFVFCWANEPWTRNWDGLQNEVLIDQQYGGEKSWKKHFDYLLRFFKHPNYIKEDNCPIFFIYKVDHIIEHKALDMLKLWKKLAQQAGFAGLKIVCMLGVNKFSETMPGYIDGFAEHQPTSIGSKGKLKIEVRNESYYIDGDDMHRQISAVEKPNGLYYCGACFSFDNSSRRVNKSFFKCINLSFASFEKLLIDTVGRIANNPHKGSNYLLLNSWNEWTEQAMVEPNDVDGYALLGIIKKIFGHG